MRSVILSLSVLMSSVSFSAGAETYKHPAEYLYPEITNSLADTYSLKTMLTCEEATRIEAKGHEISISTLIMDNVNSHVIFWNKGAEILSRKINYEVIGLSDASEKYLETLIFAPNQKNFTARDKLFLIEQGWASRIDDKEFVRSAAYEGCNQKMKKAISEYLTSELEKGEG